MVFHSLGGDDGSQPLSREPYECGCANSVSCLVSTHRSPGRGHTLAIRYSSTLNPIKSRRSATARRAILLKNGSASDFDRALGWRMTLSPKPTFSQDAIGAHSTLELAVGAGHKGNFGRPDGVVHQDARTAAFRFADWSWE